MEQSQLLDTVIKLPSYDWPISSTKYFFLCRVKGWDLSQIKLVGTHSRTKGWRRILPQRCPSNSGFCVDKSVWWRDFSFNIKRFCCGELGQKDQRTDCVAQIMLKGYILVSSWGIKAREWIPLPKVAFTDNLTHWECAVQASPRPCSSGTCNVFAAKFGIFEPAQSTGIVALSSMGHWLDTVSQASRNAHEQGLWKDYCIDETPLLRSGVNFANMFPMPPTFSVAAVTSRHQQGTAYSAPLTPSIGEK